MRRTIAGILVGMFVGATVQGQIFSAYYYPATLMQHQNEGENNWFDGLRVGYATGVADAMQFVVEFGAKSDRSYEDDYKVMSEIIECLKYRGTSVGTLTSYAVDIWRKAGDKKESAAALLAASCVTPK